MRVRCTKNKSGATRHDLSLRTEYEVIGIESGDYRLIGDNGGPYLYPRELFKVVNAARPREWETRIIDGLEYSYAPDLGSPGFFEDYFDYDAAARRTFTRYLNRHLRLTPAA